MTQTHQFGGRRHCRWRHHGLGPRSGPGQGGAGGHRAGATDQVSRPCPWRGAGPWGVAEAEELGMRIYDRLQNAKDPAAMCFVSVMVGPNRSPNWVYTDDFRFDILH